MTQISKQKAVDMGFAQLLMNVKDMFAKAAADGTHPQLAGIHENADLMQHIMGEKGAVNTATVLEYLGDLGMLAAEEAPAADSVAATAASAEAEPEIPAAAEADEEPAGEEVEAAEEPEEEESEEDDLDDQASAAMDRDPDPEPEPEEAPATAAPGQDAVTVSLAHIGGGSQDGKWVRTAEGGYVCPFCISEGRTDELFIADTPKSIGPHTRTHEVKDRAALDTVLSSLPPYTEAAVDTPEEEAPAEDDGSIEEMARVGEDTEHAVVDAAAAPEHRTLAVEEDPADVQGTAAAAAAAIDADIKQFIAAEMKGMEDRVMARLDTMETVLAAAVVSITSMSDEQRLQIFEGYAKHKAGTLSAILSREV